MKTFVPETVDNSKRAWMLVDAENKPVGRLAVKIAGILRGKTKPTFAPHVDTGDFVVVVNADKVKLTGRKEREKIYQRYTGFRSGLKRVNAAALRQKHPDQIIKLAVKGMLPKNHLSRQLFRRLKVYAGSDHPHAAQNPVKVDLL
jgi:large subunit ribosomal protein L13